MRKKIKGYEIEEQIGKGGFGEVYRAFQPEIEREVAIKAILPSHANQPEFIRRFQIEAQLVARLEHPHIVPLYDYWRDPEGAYLVMRWLRGGSLLDVVKGRDDLSLDKVAEMLEQITSALSVAHRNNVVHQDIKPANILMDDDGNAYLTDFGIAHDLKTNINLAKDTPESEIMHGSPAYISPEHLQRKPITPRSDIYSLGLLLFEVLTHRQPFEGAELMQLFNHHLRTQLPRLQEHKPELPEELNFVIHRATMKDPGARYDDVRQLAEDFRSIVEGDGIDASQPVGRVQQTSLSEAGISEYSTVIYNPYKGLRAFEEADSQDFFGRDALVEEMLQKMRDGSQYERFIAVVGPSGSGKSSAVKAGLVPELREVTDAALRNMFVVTMTPGAHPMRQLEGALLRVATRADDHFLNMLQSDDFDLHSLAALALPADDSELLLVIDQFEEVFTLAERERERKHFLQTLVKAATQRNSRVRIIITLRADFYHRPLQVDGLGTMVSQRTVVVLPMARDALEQAIVGPANRAGLLLEAGLSDRIVDDVMDASGSLPLLQFALTELYERRDGSTLTQAAYTNIGGISGAIARRAGELYEQLAPPHQRAARQMFLRLVQPGEGTEDTRRRAPQAEILSLQGDRAMFKEVLEQFGKYRLLTFDYEAVSRAPTVEIAHEALIRSWAKLRGWLDENRDRLRLQARLMQAVAEWEHGERDPSFLASGARLEEFETLMDSELPLSDDEHAYLRDSIAQREKMLRQRRRNRLFLIGTAVFAVVMAAVIAVLYVQAENARRTAIVERDRADLEAAASESRALAAASAVYRDDFDLSTLLALEALAVHDTFEARSSLLTSLQSQPRLLRLLQGHTGFVRSVAYSPNGDLIASASRDNTVRLWDAVTGQPVGEPLTGHTNWVNRVLFAPDGETLYSAGRDGVIRRWDVAGGQAAGEPLTGHDADIRSLAISPDGDLLASGDIRGTLIIWDTASGEIVEQIAAAHDDIVYALDFAPDGERLVSGGGDNVAKVWSLDTFDAEIFSGHANWVLDVRFSPDGEQIATASADRTLRLWDVDSGEATGAPMNAHTNWVRSVQFTGGGNRLLSGGVDGLVLVWDIQTRQVLDGFRTIDNAEVWDVAIAPDGESIITAGADAVPVWSAQAVPVLGELVTVRGADALDVVYSPDGAWIISAGRPDDSGTITFTPRNGGDSVTLDAHTTDVMALAVSAATNELISVDVQGRLIISDIDTQTVRADFDVNDSAFSLALSPGGDRIAVGTGSSAVALWAHADGEWRAAGEFSAHNNRVMALAYRADGAVLATGSADGSLILWNTDDNSALATVETAHRDGVEALAFAPEGTLFASGGRDSAAMIWDSSAENLTGQPLIGHNNWVFDVTFSPDSRLLASTSTDETLRLWDVQSGRAYGQPFTAHSDWVMSAAFSPDGQHVTSVSRNGTVLQWLIGVDALVQRACDTVNRNLTDDELRRFVTIRGDVAPLCGG